MPIIDKPKEWRKKVLSIFREHAKERGWAKEHATRNLAHFLFGKDDELMIKNYVEDNKQQIEAVIYKKSSSLLGWPELFDEVEAYIEHYEKEKYLIAREGDSIALLAKTIEVLYGPFSLGRHDFFSKKILHGCFLINAKISEDELNKEIEEEIKIRKKFEVNNQEETHLFSSLEMRLRWNAKDNVLRKIRCQRSVNGKAASNSGVENFVLKISPFREGLFKIFCCLKCHLPVDLKNNYDEDSFEVKGVDYSLNLNLALFSGVLGVYEKVSWGILTNNAFKEPLVVECKYHEDRFIFSFKFLNESDVFFTCRDSQYFQDVMTMPASHYMIPKYFLEMMVDR